MNQRSLLLACLAAAALSLPADAEDGYDVWLRYRAADAHDDSVRARQVRELVTVSGSETLQVAQAELQRGLAGIYGKPVAIVDSPGQPGALVLGTPKSSKLIAGLSLSLDRLGMEGYLIR